MAEEEVVVQGRRSRRSGGVSRDRGGSGRRIGM